MTNLTLLQNVAPSSFVTMHPLLQAVRTDALVSRTPTCRLVSLPCDTAYDRHDIPNLLCVLADVVAKYHERVAGVLVGAALISTVDDFLPMLQSKTVAHTKLGCIGMTAATLSEIRDTLKPVEGVPVLCEGYLKPSNRLLSDYAVFAIIEKKE